MTIAATSTTPSAWVGCLACYNAGRLIGEWFDAEAAAEITLAQVHGGAARVHPGCEELWCFDDEGIPVRGEMSPYEAAQWAETISEADEHLRPALFAWVLSGSYTAQGDAAQGSTDLPVVSDFIDRYLGEHDSFRGYIEELCRETGMFQGVSEDLERYFDWDRYAADERHSYLVLDAPAGGVYVFSC